MVRVLWVVGLHRTMAWYIYLAIHAMVEEMSLDLYAFSLLREILLVCCFRLVFSMIQLLFCCSLYDIEALKWGCWDMWLSPEFVWQVPVLRGINLHKCCVIEASRHYGWRLHSCASIQQRGIWSLLPVLGAHSCWPVDVEVFTSFVEIYWFGGSWYWSRLMTWWCWETIACHL